MELRCRVMGIPGHAGFRSSPLALLLLAGMFCFFGAAEGKAASAPVSPAPASGSSSEILVEDARGKTVQLKGIPERIVIAGKAPFIVTDAVYLFPAVWKRVVGLGREGQWADDGLRAIDPGYASKTILGREAGPEQIAGVRPDVVLMKKSSGENLGRSLEEIGIPVVCIDFEVPEQYDRDLAVLGKLFGQEERAQELIRMFHERVEKVTKSLAGIEEGKKPRVLLLYYSTRDGSTACNVPPEQWMQTILVRRAGGRPVWEGVQVGQGWTKVNFEQIAAWDPDQIFLVSYFAGTEKAKADLLSDPRWQALRAVKEKKFFAFPGDLLSWDQPDPRWVLGLAWLGLKMHPDRFPGVEMKAEMKAFFRDFYGLAPETTDQVLGSKLNGDL